MSDEAPATLAHRPCPCGLGASYGACCGRFHRGPPYPPCPDAATLMRSRYSAYVLDQTDYLLATWHPDTRPPELAPSPPGLHWLGLQVRDHRCLDADHEEVEFVARSKRHGRAHRLHERSRFVREDGRWYYVDGDLHERPDAPVRSAH